MLPTRNYKEPKIVQLYNTPQNYESEYLKQRYTFQTF